MDWSIVILVIGVLLCGVALEAVKAYKVGQEAALERAKKRTLLGQRPADDS